MPYELTPKQERPPRPMAIRTPTVKVPRPPQPQKPPKPPAPEGYVQRWKK